jgi:type III pantothenate kinase
MNLLIDIGNTFIKTGVFDKKNLIASSAFKTYSNNTINSIINKYHPTRIGVASVGKVPALKFKNNKQVSFITNTTRVPIKNLYKTPKTLGIDRIAAAVYAGVYYKNKNCLIIDAGSCITIDFIDKNGNYKGGSISPGIKMRYKALHTFTANLPLLENIKKVPLTGNNTQRSVESGVLNGVLMEIKGVIQEYKSLYPDVKVLLTGGDQNYIKNQFKKEIFAISNMVLIGLNEILEYNKN